MAHNNSWGLHFSTLSIIMLLCLTGCGRVAEQGKIAFSSDHDQNLEIYVMNADGTDLQRITNNFSMDDMPVWSPDGKQIAFVSNRDVDYQIYIVTIDNKQVVKLDYEQNCRGAYWFYDSQNIIMTCDESRVYAFNINTSTKELLFELPLRTEKVIPSSDGTRFLFVSTDIDFPGLYYSDSAGAVFELLKDVVLVSDLIWASDSYQAAFISRERDNVGIYIVDLKTNRIARIVSAVVYRMAWSYDGQQVAFTSMVDRMCGLYIIDVDGNNQRLLTNEMLDCERIRISWSPNNQFITFQSTRDYTRDVGQQIYTIDVTTNAVTRLTNRTGNDINPIWSP